MYNFTYSYTTKVYFGEGAAEQALGEELPERTLGLLMAAMMVFFLVWEYKGDGILYCGEGGRRPVGN